jgi:16S rRNA (uracil1498-N3)-methyltransferase
MNVFFADQPLTVDGSVVLDDLEHRHLALSLRKRPGEEIAITNGRGIIASAILESVGKKTSVAIVSTVKEYPEGPARHLILGFIKHRERQDWVLEKAVELGATAITLVATDHAEKDRVNAVRIRQLVIAAMKQSGRSWLVPVATAGSLADAWNTAGALRKVVAHEKVAASQRFFPDTETGYALFVGPEGGFSHAEIAFVESQQAQLVSLGPNRLRAETAALAMLSRF